MDIAYNGIRRYAPLIVTLANSNEVLYLVNRPGNRPSSDGAAAWMDRALDLVAPVFQKVWLRGDTDFSLTSNFDRWDEKVGFVFGYDAKPNLVDMAEALPETAWKPLQRPARYEVKTEHRRAKSLIMSSRKEGTEANGGHPASHIKIEKQTLQAENLGIRCGPGGAGKSLWINALDPANGGFLRRQN